MLCYVQHVEVTGSWRLKAGASGRDHALRRVELRNEGVLSGLRDAAVEGGGSPSSYLRSDLHGEMGVMIHFEDSFPKPPNGDQDGLLATLETRAPSFVSPESEPPPKSRGSLPPRCRGGGPFAEIAECDEHRCSVSGGG